MSIDVQFCNGLLREARADIKKAKVKVGKLTTWHSTGWYKEYWEVYEEGKKGIAWGGCAECASHAKYQYLMTLLEGELTEHWLPPDSMGGFIL